MTTSNHSHAALLQLIAEGMRSASGDRLNPVQRARIAGLLDRIAVDLLVPTESDDADEPFVAVTGDIDCRTGLNS